MRLFPGVAEQGFGFGKFDRLEIDQLVQLVFEDDFGDLVSD